MKTLITFSGGLDSTYSLWKLLSETSDEVTAVFINVENIEPGLALRYDLRAFSGSDSTTAAIAAQWLQTNVRSFNFVSQPFDASHVVRGVGNANSPQTYIARYAIPRINSGEFDRLICTSEKENDGWSNGGSINSRRPGSVAAREIFVAGATRGSIEFPLITSNYTQANAIAEMPSALMDIVALCPVENDGYKCMKKRWFQNLLDQGKTPAQCYDIWYQKCTSYQNKWFTMKTWLYDVAPDDNNTWGTLPQWPTNYSA